MEKTDWKKLILEDIDTRIENEKVSVENYYNYIKTSTEKIDKYHQLESLMKNIKFKVGGVAFTREYGNCIIRRIYLNGSELWVSIAAVNGSQQTAYSNLLESKGMGEVLYGAEND